jgi:hypothetical protein
LASLAEQHAAGELTDAEFEQATRSALSESAPQPSAAETPFETEQTADSGPPRWLFIGGGVVVLAVVIVAVLAFAGGSNSKGLPVHGTFTISNLNYDATNEFADPNFQSDGSGGCEGNGGYQDLNSIEQVVVTDNNGKEVARTELGSGKERHDECVFDFTFDVKKGPKYYVVTIGHRGSSQYTYEQLQKPGAVALIIGTN